jgi:signal transduction histidine kinase
MVSPLERRRGAGRRRSDDHDTAAIRGLLHDLGHEMTALSFLVEAVRGDVTLRGESSSRLELLSLEVSRLLGVIGQGLGDGALAGRAEPVELRPLVAQLARLASLAHGTQVLLLPGPDVTASLNPVLLWRVLSNLVDNAARAAGRAGTVTLEIRQGAETVIDVTDDGPGFGAGPAGTGSIGLEVVTTLLEACGGSLEVQSPPGGGTTARVTVPTEVPATTRAGAGVGG